MTTTKFLVSYKGKTTPVLAERADSALEKFANREFFGNRRIWDYRISQVDAETRGGEWVEAYTRGDDAELRIVAYREEGA